jgi:glycosyltransferase involved in cell wall biosynthesis
MISVIIPVYNSGKHIMLTLRSLLNATDDLSLITEIILTDDNSRDSTIDIIQSIQQSFPVPVRLLRLPENAGQHAATLAGIKHARGIYCLTMDDDVTFQQFRPATLINDIEKHPGQLIYLVTKEDLTKNIKYKTIVTLIRLISHADKISEYGSSQRFFKITDIQKHIATPPDYIYLDILFPMWGLQTTHRIADYQKHRHELRRYNLWQRVSLITDSILFYRIALLHYVFAAGIMTLNIVLYGMKLWNKNPWCMVILNVSLFIIYILRVNILKQKMKNKRIPDILRKIKE